jgi:C1A family cysteine protease
MWLFLSSLVNLLAVPQQAIDADGPLCGPRSINDVFIQEHNNQNHSYEVGHNQFSEVVYHQGKNPATHHYLRGNGKKKTPFYEPEDDESELPIHVDWRKWGDVSSVKNQLECGSCWAFSATGAIESAWSIHRHALYNLSQQELVDCSIPYGNMGCNGGEMDAAFQYVIDNGLCANQSYPYTANDTGTCLNTTCQKVVHITNFSDIQPNNEHALAKAVTRQPVAVAIQANLQSFQLYTSGIYSDPDCGDDLDHGVLVVGYGYDWSKGMDYWIVKNSWGPSWGENGYMRMLKYYDNPEGLCGIAMDPSIPLL